MAEGGRDDEGREDALVRPGDPSASAEAETWRAAVDTVERRRADLRRRRFRVIVGGIVALLLIQAAPRISEAVQNVMAGPPAPIPHPEAADPRRILPPVTDVDVAAASQYALVRTQPDGSGEPVTWDPCVPIHYVVRDAHGAGAAGRQAITDAVALVSAATGLAFVDDGDTTEAPSDARAVVSGAYATGVSPVLIAWSDPSETPRLEGRTVGVGGGTAFGVGDGREAFLTGQIRLDAPQLLEDIGTRSGAAYAEAVVVHELGHVIGADHSEADNQLMAAEGGGPAHLGRGDRYVFSVLGQGRCSTVAYRS